MHTQGVYESAVRDAVQEARSAYASFVIASYANAMLKKGYSFQSDEDNLLGDDKYLQEAAERKDKAVKRRNALIYGR